MAAQLELVVDELKAERAKSEQLLLNVLPAAIAERLKAEQQPIADHFADATVLFADIVDFTYLSSQLQPDSLVSWLNEIFSAFDGLAEKHGLEKIKTIGDSYMIVAGVPDPRPDHVQAMARMALDMQDELTRHHAPNGAPMQMRIGIHTGQVVAGVIGTKKFIYDLWGDTVNTASRMESHGLSGNIQVTATTYERLRDSYDFEPRGSVPIKGKGDMPVYLLRQPLVCPPLQQELVLN
jgi:class 3 adenylate cyclase